MGNRKTPLVTNEYYHIFLRGVEKRNIVIDDNDVDRFMLSMKTFNSVKPVGSIHEHCFKSKKQSQLGSETSKLTSKLVDILAFNILPNHYHILLEQLVDGGISKYMQSLNGGYTKYFNNRYKRIGPLFQGVFGSSLINSDAHLTYISAYVNLNHVVHGRELGSETSKWGGKSSWEQYVITSSRDYTVSCNTEIVLSLYEDKDEYKKDAEEVANMIASERKREKKEEEEVLQEYLEVRLPNFPN